MAKVTSKIVLTKDDLMSILCEEFKLNPKTANLQVYVYEGDQRDPSYTEIIIEGQSYEPKSTTN